MCCSYFIFSSAFNHLRLIFSVFSCRKTSPELLHKQASYSALIFQSHGSITAGSSIRSQLHTSKNSYFIMMRSSEPEPASEVVWILSRSLNALQSPEQIQSTLTWLKCMHYRWQSMSKNTIKLQAFVFMKESALYYRSYVCYRFKVLKFSWIKAELHSKTFLVAICGVTNDTACHLNFTYQQYNMGLLVKSTVFLRWKRTLSYPDLPIHSLLVLTLIW